MLFIVSFLGLIHLFVSNPHSVADILDDVIHRRLEIISSAELDTGIKD